MNNTRKFWRSYAKAHDKEAFEFVKIDSNNLGDTLITKDRKGTIEETPINYERITYFLISFLPNDFTF